VRPSVDDVEGGHRHHHLLHSAQIGQVTVKRNTCSKTTI
jgi:hypothetical protein